MSNYLHYVAGFFSSREQAEKAALAITTSEILPDAVQIFDKYAVLPTSAVGVPSSENNRTLGLNNTDPDSLVGTGLESLTRIKLVKADVSLLVERVLIAPLVAAGWGINIGTVGIDFYNREEPRLLADLVHDAVLSRQLVIVVRTGSEEQTGKVSAGIKGVISNLHL